MLSFFVLSFLVQQIDFVVVIDHSSSMRMDNKLAFVQATIEYLISKLDESHRFCLIQVFNRSSLLFDNQILSSFISVHLFLTVVSFSLEVSSYLSHCPQFNQEVELVTEGLMVMNRQNQEKVVQLLHNVKPEGSTNISDALFCAIELLKKRSPDEHNRISSIMLFTGKISDSVLAIVIDNPVLSLSI